MNRGPRMGQRSNPAAPADSKKDASAPVLWGYGSRWQRPQGHFVADTEFNFRLKLKSPLRSAINISAEDFCREIQDFAISRLCEFTLDDLFNKRYQGAKIALDTMAKQLTALVKSDILKANGKKQKQQHFDYYCQCLKQSIHRHDFITAYAIYLALNAPDIDRLKTKIYTVSLQNEIRSNTKPAGFVKLKRKYKESYKDALRLFQESSGVYESLLTKIAGKQRLPWMIPIYKKADRILQMDTLTATDTAKVANAKIGLLFDIKLCINSFTQLQPQAHQANCIEYALLDRDNDDEPVEDIVEDLQALDLSDTEDESPPLPDWPSDFEESDSDTDIVVFEPSVPGVLALLSQPQPDQKDTVDRPKLSSTRHASTRKVAK